MRRSRWVLVAFATAALVGVTTTLAVTQFSTRGATDGSPVPSTRSNEVAFGLISPSDAQMSSLRGSSLSVVVIPTSWKQIEPQNGTYDKSALSRIHGRIALARQLGLRVILDLGLQYPPGWVFDLPGSTRFVDQYGDTWSAGLSQDVPNAVFNAAVRSAQAAYIATLGAALDPSMLAAVRVGGLLSGELRYPPARYAGHQDALWAFDPSALAASPDPSWRPGSRSEEATRRVLTWYLGALTDYLGFQLDTVAAAFPAVGLQVLMPSWGLRPGMLDQAVSTRFGPDTPTDVADLIASGLDWASQVALIASRPQRVTPYTTWLDAPDNGSTSRSESPISYLASLATPRGLPLAGENTGGGGQDALTRSYTQAERYGLTTAMYMSGDLVRIGQAGLDLSDLLATAKAMAR